MPLGIKSPLISLTGKPDLGCLGTAPSYGFTTRRQTVKGLQVTAAAVHPWPWRSMGSSMNVPSLREGVKLPPSSFAPHVSGQSAKQADPGSTWHAVDLQEGSAPSVASAVESNEAAAKAFRVQSPQQVQVHHHDDMHTTCSRNVLQWAHMLQGDTADSQSAHACCTEACVHLYVMRSSLAAAYIMSTGIFTINLLSFHANVAQQEYKSKQQNVVANSRLCSCRMSSIALCWQRRFTRFRRETMPRWLALLLLCARTSLPRWSLCKGYSGPYLMSLTGLPHTSMHARCTVQCRWPSVLTPSCCLVFLLDCACCEQRHHSCVSCTSSDTKGQLGLQVPAG